MVAVRTECGPFPSEEPGSLSPDVRPRAANGFSFVWRLARPTAADATDLTAAESNGR